MSHQQVLHNFIIFLSHSQARCNARPFADERANGRRKCRGERGILALPIHSASVFTSSSCGRLRATQEKRIGIAREGTSPTGDARGDNGEDLEAVLPVQRKMLAQEDVTL
ncbi:hypothetical protein SKAU_G00175870 [Synaphobranchus kaupii]|uniref:Uncharacterized protein n=1 Tax=Synaphobranchus kaupii TaxID=118154 RepID=A0A9Q1FLV4_SYNKA|nr:hypothetical protein SKAU_G00175870 [Synaphobranchus kaupii]